MNFWLFFFLAFLEIGSTFASNHTKNESENTNEVVSSYSDSYENEEVDFASDKFDKTSENAEDRVSNIANHDDAVIHNVSGVVDIKSTESRVNINNNSIVHHLDDTTDHVTTDVKTESSTSAIKTEPQLEEEDKQTNDTESFMYYDIRLPPSLRPKQYNITIQPFIYGNNPKEFWFSCETIIQIACEEPTSVIMLHSVNHNITFMSIANDTGIVELANWWINDELEMILIKSQYQLLAEGNYILTIRSVSSMSETLRGFYYSPYKEGNQTKYIVTTMMEPTDARKVFPCFDEPDFKAVFIFNIKRKKGLRSLTNLPKRLTVGPDEDGFYTDIFDEPRDVPMSSYLVAIAVGDLDSLTSTVNNVTFRTWCRSKEVNKTKYALEIGMKFMEFFEDYFQIPYSLPKEDMIGVPTMSFGGMEHWGLITYRESMLFYEEGISSLSDKETMTIIIAHEVAHQWFGNLVSPYWWDDLWLNEGFATYMMFLAVDRVLPSWNMVNKLVVETRGVHNVMQKDDNKNTHPVYVSVYNPDDINKIFDLISYAKGGSVIRMMNFFLGEDTFRKGLTRYLKDFSYKTATHNDLWFSLSKQALVDNHTYTDVKAVMDTWVLEENYPVVTVSFEDGNTILLTQSAFLETEDQRRERSHVVWKIPFVYTTDIERNFDKTFSDITWISNKTAYVTDNSIRNISWIIGNLQQYGFYRVNYDEKNWYALLDQLLTDHTVIHPINRAQIINDAWNLARAGLLDMQIALKTLDYLDGELDFVPWKAALRELNHMRTSLQFTPLYGAIEHFMRKMLEKTYLITADARDHYNRLQYSMVSKIACDVGLEECIDDAMEMFNFWRSDDNFSVDPDLKDMVYCTGVKHGGEEAWAHVLRNYIDSESTTEQNFLLDALSCTEQPYLLMTLAEMLFKTDAFSKTSKVSVLLKLSDTPTGRLLAWNILEENWKDIQDEFGEDINMFSGIIHAMTHSFNTEPEINRIRWFVKHQTNLGRAESMFEDAINYAESNMKLKDAYYEAIKAWLKNYNTDD